MNYISEFMSRIRLRNQLLKAEVDARMHRGGSPDDRLACSPSASTETWMTQEDEVRYRRILAKLHYGEPTNNREYERLLTDDERGYLDSYVIQQRWASVWIRRMNQSGPMG